ncbi:hypothetical protein SADO_04455 [Salinisphaera dokdonensis CL-ES53]|uniref:DUF4139 domain-containing protein n=1 Tax=Salinisphaera dokdonensis CL-ES53 TaxID=1304272 RepID=A0ABV2AXV5_9GAMM
MISKLSTPALFTAALLGAPAFAQSAGEDDGAVDAMAIYNRGAAVIQTTRDINLDTGMQTVGWPIDGRLRADTLWLEGDGVRLTGLSARSSDDSGAGLLAARVGQPVTLLRDDSAGQAQTREATLVGLSGDSALVRVDDRIERLTPNSLWRLAWPAGGDAPSGLQLDIEADSAGSQPLTATYQIDGPSWQASYTGRFDAEAGELSLQSLAVIDNSGGSDLNAKQAWLVAGDVSRANGRGPQPMMMARSEAKMSDSAPQAVGDTYRYTLDGPLKVAAGATRAVSMMAPVTLDAERRYRFENSFYALGRDGARSHAAVQLHFENSSDEPLPAGVVRVYDGNRKATLMGEDSIADTPKGAPVTLAMGSAFDITGERRMVEDSKTENNQRKRSVEITLHNASERDATVDVVEHLPDAADVVSSSIEPRDDSAANTATWEVDVPANGKTTLSYSASWPG